MPLASARIRRSSGSASWNCAWKRASIESCSAVSAPASASASRIAFAAMALIVNAGGVRSGSGKPSNFCNSPLLYIDCTMSAPPISSPLTYNCGIVGKLP